MNVYRAMPVEEFVAELRAWAIGVGAGPLVLDKIEDTLEELEELKEELEDLNEQLEALTEERNKASEAHLAAVELLRKLGVPAP